MPVSITEHARWRGFVEPDLTPRDAEPMFPITSFVPASACPHRMNLSAGSRFCCMVCHESGLDALPALQRDPRTDPKPEPPAPMLALPAPEPEKPKSGKMAKRKAARRAKDLEPAA